VAGFMSGPLGFSSTIGAAIGGAARQANELFAEDRAKQRQDDILDQARAADADKAAQKWNAQKQEYSKQLMLRDSIKSRLNGNEAAVDAVMAQVLMNPKIIGTDNLNSLINDAGQHIAPQSNYKSPFTANMQSAADTNFGVAQSYGNRLGPKNRGQVQPITPFDASSGQGQPSGSAPQAQVPQTIAPAQPSAQQPSQSGYSPEALGPEQNNAPAAGEPIPLDRPTAPTNVKPPPGTPNTFTNESGPFLNPGAPNQPSGDTPQSATPGFTPIPLKKDQFTPYQQSRVNTENRNAQTREDELKWKMSQKTASPEEAAELAEKAKTYDKYYSDPHNGLQFRYNQLQSIGQQHVDIQEMYNLLTGGFQANKPQPMFDELNRLTKPMLGLDLSVGSGPDIPGIDKRNYANSVEGTTLMKKAINNAIINRLSQLHFGRITNKEANYVESGMPNSGTDPNTNMKIVLAMKADIEKTQAQTMKEYEIANSDPNHPIASSILARQAVQQMNQERYNSPLPWTQAHTDEDVKNMPIGQWFETPKGTMAIQISPGVFRKAGQALQ